MGKAIIPRVHLHHGGEVWWVGKQWVVTSLGMEPHKDADYFVDAGSLDDTCPDQPPGTMPDWLVHMGGKSWIDLEDFFTAFCVALILHGKGGSFTFKNMWDGRQKAHELHKK